MALKKQITISQPFEASQIAEYWVITEYHSNKRDNRTEVMLTCYKNREDSKTEYPTEYMRIMFNFEGMDLRRNELYPMIKQDVRFADAIDV